MARLALPDAAYLDTLCFGVGAARNVIPDTARIAELARQSFAELSIAVIQSDRTGHPIP